METMLLSQIETKDTLQPRASMNFIIISDYAEAMKEGQIFPPLDVVFDGQTYWLWDGFHRKKAAEQIGLTEINVRIEEGDLERAEWLALGANRLHGFRRSNEDKRRAVTLALEHPEAKKLSDRQLASHCGVHYNFVGKLRQLSHEVIDKRTGKDGRTRDTANIGRNKNINPPIAANITPEVKSRLSLTDITDNPIELVKLDKLDDATQLGIVSMIADGEADTIVQARQKIARERQPEPTNTPPLPTNKYRCIVIDPPWPVKKIEREDRPTQGVKLDYPIMTLEEIKDLPVANLAANDGCHLYLWVTQKYLPFGIELVKEWGFNYQCLMTWCKNVGMTPYSWMYDTEHVIFARCGSLQLDKLGLRLSFNAKTQGHSVKPEMFFDERVKPASPAPRLEMFARKIREGFSVWGNEVNE